MDTRLDLASLVAHHQAGLWRYLRVLGADRAQADELTQETFLAVLEKPFDDYHPAATAAYLRKVARNLFISAQRRLARGVQTVGLEAADDAWARWAADDQGESALAALAACLQALGERARRALDLRFKQQLSRAGIAAALQMSEDGAKNLLQRAKQHLRRCIDRRMQ